MGVACLLRLEAAGGECRPALASRANCRLGEATMICKIYRERSGGRWVYWLYVDGDRVFLSAEAVRREERRGNVRIITA